MIVGNGLRPVAQLGVDIAEVFIGLAASGAIGDGLGQVVADLRPFFKPQALDGLEVVGFAITGIARQGILDIEKIGRAIIKRR